MESILNSIKKMLGIVEDYTYFDQDLIIHINSVLDVLYQIGVGSLSNFHITGSTETWSEFIDDDSNLELIKSYVYLKVRLLFDPPLSSSVVESIKNLINEMEWRINIFVDNGKEV